MSNNFLADEEFAKIILGMCKLGETYMRIQEKIKTVYRDNPVLHFEASMLMEKAGYEYETFDMVKLVNRCFEKNTSEEIRITEKKLFYEYAQKFYDPILVEEQIVEYVGYDRAERASMVDRLRDQMKLFPDPSLGMADLFQYGYQKYDLFPIRSEIALELVQHTEIHVYAATSDGENRLLKDADSVKQYTGMFGIKRQEWFSYQIIAFREGRTLPFDFKEPEKGYRIYQLKDDLPDLRDYSFMPYDVVSQMGLTICLDHYDLKYEARITEESTLDDIYTMFNLYHPADFLGHSLSVSDVVAIEEADGWAAYYVDPFGFTKLDGFLDGVIPEIIQEDAKDMLPKPKAENEKHTEGHSTKESSMLPADIKNEDRKPKTRLIR